MNGEGGARRRFFLRIRWRWWYVWCNQPKYIVRASPSNHMFLLLSSMFMGHNGREECTHKDFFFSFHCSSCSSRNTPTNEKEYSHLQLKSPWGSLQNLHYWHKNKRPHWMEGILVICVWQNRQNPTIARIEAPRSECTCVCLCIVQIWILFPFFIRVLGLILFSSFYFKGRHIFLLSSRSTALFCC